MKTACPIPATTQIETLQQPQSFSEKDRKFLDRIKHFFCGCAVSSKRTAQRARNLLNSSLVHLSTVTTPNGPWVYTIVPWED
jgi:hypothetical protein